MGLGRWDEARHWLQQALERGHLQFLRKASEQLQRAAWPQLAETTATYTRRCAELESGQA
ncbi:hypothetical protein D3C86_2266530 [compost metagenome]